MSALVQFAAATEEPLTVSQVMAHAKIDASNQEPAPGVITAALASPAAAGNLSSGVYRWLATFVTSAGETQAGEGSASVTSAPPATTGKPSLSGIPIGALWSRLENFIALRRMGQFSCWLPP